MTREDERGGAITSSELVFVVSTDNEGVVVVLVLVVAVVVDAILDVVTVVGEDRAILS